MSVVIFDSFLCVCVVVVFFCNGKTPSCKKNASKNRHFACNGVCGNWPNSAVV